MAFSEVSSKIRLKVACRTTLVATLGEYYDEFEAAPLDESSSEAEEG